MKLTPKQKAFADYYIETGNAYESAKRAGYSENYAKVSSHKMLENVSLKSYIEERMKELESTRIASISEVKEFWSNVLRDNKEDMKNRLKAAEYLAKSGGAFLDRIEANVQMVSFTGEGDILD